MKNPKFKTLIWLIIIAVFTTHCQMYHIQDVDTSDFVVNPNKKNRLSYHLIVHGQDGKMTELMNPTMTSWGVSGTPIAVKENIEKLYHYALTKRNFRGKVRSNREDLNQLHLFVDQSISQDAPMSVSFKDLQKVQVLDKNQGLTNLSALGVGVSTAYASLFIYLAIACNCPHAYVHNGTNWEFTNSLYTGAVHPSLERFDIKSLIEYKPNATRYALQIRNELEETHYTNSLKLMAVYHAADQTVVSDQNGQVFAVTQKIRPFKAADDNGASVLEDVLTADQEASSFETIDPSNFSHLYASFQAKEWAPNTALVLRAKNSSWGGFVYHQFTGLFGEKYDNWVASNAHKTKEEFEKSLNKTGMLLDVEVKEGKQWKRIDQIQLVGEKAFNTIAVQIPQQYLQNETVEIRFKSGFHFWEIDELYMAATTQDGLEIVEYNAATPTKSDTEALLAADDAKYFVHNKGEEALNITFNGLRPEPRTLFLISKGYYKSDQTFEGKPDYKALLSIRKDGGFSAFSKEQFDILLRINAYLAEISSE